MATKKSWLKPLSVLLVLVGLGIMLKFSGFSSIEPQSVNLLLNEPLPDSFASCNRLGGGCVPPLENPKGTLDYGTCGAEFKCVVPDNCVSTGGIYRVEFNVSKGEFDKRCLCKIPKIYKVSEGCGDVYG